MIFYFENPELTLSTIPVRAPEDSVERTAGYVAQLNYLADLNGANALGQRIEDSPQVDSSDNSEVELSYPDHGDGILLDETEPTLEWPESTTVPIGTLVEIIDRVEVQSYDEQVQDLQAKSLRKAA